MSLMIPIDSAEGAMHTLKENWGGTSHTWSINSRLPVWGGLLLGSTSRRWMAGMGRKRTWQSSWRAIIGVTEGNDVLMGPPSLSRPPSSISIPPSMLALSYSPVVPLLRPFKLGKGGGIDCPASSFC